MVRHGIIRMGSLLGLIVCCGFGIGQTPETVYHSVTSEKLESLLRDLAISYQKAPGKKDKVFTYEFERKGCKVRLYNYGGEDLWIESDFAEKASLEEVNRWNMRAKFSRAVFVKNGASASISLEGQVDCSLGITDGMIRQFVQRFDAEIEAFVNFLKK